MRINVEDHIGLAKKLVTMMTKSRPGDKHYDDNLQQAMLAMSRVAPTFDPSRGKWSTLARTAVVRELDRRLARDRRKREANFVWAHWPHEKKGQRLRCVAKPESVSPELRDLWEQAERLCSPRQREVFDSVFRDGHTRSETAVALGCSKQFVSQQIERLLDKLRAQDGLLRDWRGYSTS